MFGAIQAVAPALGVEVTPIGVHDIGDIERAMEAFARSPNGGLIVTGTATMPVVTRDLIITLAVRHKLPAVYAFRFMVTAGGLVSYSPPDYADQFRLAAGYVDRILKGEKPADLPVQAPPNTNWLSTSKLQRRSASTSQRPYSPAPTR